VKWICLNCGYVTANGLPPIGDICSKCNTRYVRRQSGIAESTPVICAGFIAVLMAIIGLFIVFGLNSLHPGYEVYAVAGWSLLGGGGTLLQAIFVYWVITSVKDLKNRVRKLEAVRVE